MKRPTNFFLLTFGSLVLAAKKNLIIDTDLFSDVDDAAALLLVASTPDVNLLAVNVNYPSSYSALAASAILAHYGKVDVPIGIPRPLTNATFFDSWYFTLGEYASKVAYHFSGGSLPWGHAEDAWDPVVLYRRVLSQAEDRSVTIVSIGFLDNLSALLNSTADAYSPLTGRALVARKVVELVVMGGGYPSGRSWNFWGSPSGPSAAAHVINTWGDDNNDDGDDDDSHAHAYGRGNKIVPPLLTFLGDDVGLHVLAGGPLVSHGPKNDPVRMAYRWYGYEKPARASWDLLAVLYAVHGLGGVEGRGGGGIGRGLFRVGDGECEGMCGYNWVEGDGSNRWVCEGAAAGTHGSDGGGHNGSRPMCAKNQRFLRLAVANETAAAEVDRLLLWGAWSAVRGEMGVCDAMGIYAEVGANSACGPPGILVR